MRERELLLLLEELPVVIGPVPTPSNPAGVPNTLPFALEFDHELGLLVQRVSEGLSDLLSSVYSHGSLIGTAMDDTAAGHTYAQDFLAFIESYARRLAGLDALEIGAGRGYLLRLLASRGANAIGIEPGGANVDDWTRHGVRVVRDLFPSPMLPESFDLVVAYGVLEHVPDPLSFATDIRSSLRQGGQVVLAVPDCEPYIDSGDPSMLLHEHMTYFTTRSLQRLLTAAGFNEVSTVRAGYGGVVYARANATGERRASNIDPDEIQSARHYSGGVTQARSAVQRRYISARSNDRQVGVYVPSRALNLLPLDANVRFFDDDFSHHGLFHPPFPNKIESRDDLRTHLVDEIWIMSRTFGAQILTEVRTDGRLASLNALTVEELL